MASAARSLVRCAVLACLLLSSSRAAAFTAPSRHGWHVANQRSSHRPSPSSSSLGMERRRRRGCAATPLDKKRVAVFGAGGYLGAVLFGFLQRAGSLYGTGIAGGSSPRAICATSGGSQALNTVLAAQFKYAYAGEDLVRLVNTMDVSHVEERLSGYDAAVLGTAYRLEKRPPTPNTYDGRVTDRTYEIYLDDRYGAWDVDVPTDGDGVHLDIFRNAVRACKGAGVSHLAVLETHRTVDPDAFVRALEEEGVPYTYVRALSGLTKDKSFSFEKGVRTVPDVRALSPGTELDPFYVPESYERVAPRDLTARLTGAGTTIASEDRTAAVLYREDLAALVVQCLMTLDWETSRILEVSSAGPDAPLLSSGYEGLRVKKKFDREWCPNSDLLGEVLSAL